MMTIKALKTGLLTCALLALGGAEIAHAKSPVVVEFFGKNACVQDTDTQDNILDILKKNSDVILVNCRKHYQKESEDRKFSQEFCNERGKIYSEFFGYPSSKTPLIVVNGRWDAFWKNIEPAVKIGHTDNVSPISLTLRDKVIDIEIPDIKSESSTGILFLYAYMPTQGDKKILVDPDVELTPQIEAKIRANQSVPFVQQARLSNFYLRPVYGREKIGYWKGSKLSLSYSLDAITSLAGDDYNNLSYVVVLHEGSGTGPVIGAGEVMSRAELAKVLPNSRPLDIEFTSFPLLNQAATPPQ